VYESGHGPTGLLSGHSPGEIEENHEKVTQEQTESWSKFEPGNFRNRSRNATHSIDLKTMSCEHKDGSDLLQVSIPAFTCRLWGHHDKPHFG
jgi:hypothetical protein